MAITERERERERERGGEGEGGDRRRGLKEVSIESPGVPPIR
jgi:hypothetical protein